MTYTRVYAIFCDFCRFLAGLDAVLLVVGLTFDHPVPGLEGLLATRQVNIVNVAQKLVRF